MFGGYQPHLPVGQRRTNNVSVAEFSKDSVVSGNDTLYSNFVG